MNLLSTHIMTFLLVRNLRIFDHGGVSPEVARSLNNSLINQFTLRNIQLNPSRRKEILISLSVASSPITTIVLSQNHLSSHLRLVTHPLSALTLGMPPSPHGKCCELLSGSLEMRSVATSDIKSAVRCCFPGCIVLSPTPRSTLFDLISWSAVPLWRPTS